MFTPINRDRFISVLSLHLKVLVILVLPLAANADIDQSPERFSTVLAQGQEPREGFTSLLAVPNGINGSFEFGGKIVHFQTRRGLRTPKYLRDGDPATPNFEIDVRFIDQDGRPFLTQIGGDVPLDNTWVEVAPKPKADRESKADFELAAKTIGTLKKLKFKQKFDHERQALLNLASIVESAQVIEKIEGIPSQTSPSTQTLALANTYRHRVAIHEKSCCLGLGHHSATIGKYISNSGVVTTAVITCNHGSCANQMALKCNWTSTYPGNRTTQVNNDITCSTLYNPTSVFGHNSNDDTDLQYRAVRSNSRPSTSGGICNDSSTNNEPTSCY
jgi:hypothetical protein